MNNPNFKSDYVLAHQHELDLIRSFYNGFDEALDYIKPYKSEDDNALATRKELSSLTNYTREAVDTIRNMIFRKSTNFDKLIGTQYEYLADEDLLKSITLSVALYGHAYILVEKEQIDQALTKADDNKYMPYFVIIERPSVLNFRESDGVFRQFTYNEAYEVDKGKYGFETKVQQRVYLEDGTVEIWRDNAMYQSMSNGLGYIPIVKVGVEDISQFYDLAILNRSHFNLKSEQRNYVRMCANPIGVLNQFGDQKVTIGANTWLNFDAPVSEAGFQWKELAGTNNTVIQTLIDKLENDMRGYISTLTDTIQGRTATEISLINTNNESMLNDYKNYVEEGFNRALEIAQDYQGTSIEDLTVALNTDFISDKLSEGQIASYQNLYREGVISWRLLMDALIKGEVIEAMSEDDLEKMKNELVLG